MQALSHGGEGEEDDDAADETGSDTEQAGDADADAVQAALKIEVRTDAAGMASNSAARMRFSYRGIQILCKI